MASPVDDYLTARKAVEAATCAVEDVVHRIQMVAAITRDWHHLVIAGGGPHPATAQPILCAIAGPEFELRELLGLVGGPV